MSVLQNGDKGRTVWTVRFTTAPQRGNYLDPTSGVLVGLVGTEGNSLLHRISAIHDPEEVKAELTSILKVLPARTALSLFSWSVARRTSDLSFGVHVPRRSLLLSTDPPDNHTQCQALPSGIHSKFDQLRLHTYRTCAILQYWLRKCHNLICSLSSAFGLPVMKHACMRSQHDCTCMEFCMHPLVNFASSEAFMQFT